MKLLSPIGKSGALAILAYAVLYIGVLSMVSTAPQVVLWVIRWFTQDMDLSFSVAVGIIFVIIQLSLSLVIVSFFVRRLVRRWRMSWYFWTGVLTMFISQLASNLIKWDGAMGKHIPFYLLELVVLGTFTWGAAKLLMLLNLIPDNNMSARRPR